MARNTKWFQKVGIELLKNVPEGVFFDTNNESLSFQANTQADVAMIRQAFPGAVWIKAWDRDCLWWTYVTSYQGVALKIYAVSEAPRTCSAIMETRVVEKQVPVTFKTQRVEEQVIVGWNCGAVDGEAIEHVET